MNEKLDTKSKLPQLRRKQLTHELTSLKRALLETTSSASIETRVNKLAMDILPSAEKSLQKGSIDLIFMFDCSGSCRGTEVSTIKGYEQLIDREKRKNETTKITTILFNNVSEMIHDRVDAEQVRPLRYNADGGTSLYDTICERLEYLEGTRPTFLNNHLVVIMTDGNDVSSTKYSLQDARSKILELQSKGWKFIFLGANMDAKEVSTELGIEEKYAETYLQTNDNILINFSAVSKAMEDIRETGEIKADWSSSIKKANQLENGPVLRLESKKKNGK